MGGRPGHGRDHFKEIKRYKIKERSDLKSGVLLPEDVLKSKNGKAVALFDKKDGGTGKQYSNPHFYFVLSVNPKDIVDNIDKEYDVCRVTIEVTDDDNVGDDELLDDGFCVYYIEPTADFRDGDVGAGDCNGIPVFPNDVLPTSEHIISKVDSPSKSPSKRKATTYSKKKAGSPNKKKRKKKQNTEAKRPANPVFVKAVVKKGMHLLATTDLLDRRGEVRSKLMILLRRFFLTDIDLYLPVVNDPRWDKMVTEAKGML